MYCVRFKKNTDTKKNTIRIEQTKNGKIIKERICDVCGETKAQFVKKNELLYEGKCIREDIIEELHKPLRKKHSKTKHFHKRFWWSKASWSCWNG